jgi:flagellar basal body-associated protein FliL
MIDQSMRIKRDKSRTWVILIVVLLLIALVVAVVSSKMADNTPKTMADPPTESEVTFNMETNRAYNADDGIVVIPASTTLKNGIVKASEPASTTPGETEPVVSVKFLSSGEKKPALK